MWSGGCCFRRDRDWRFNQQVAKERCTSGGSARRWKFRLLISAIRLLNPPPNRGIANAEALSKPGPLLNLISEIP